MFKNRNHNRRAIADRFVINRSLLDVDMVNFRLHNDTVKECERKYLCTTSIVDQKLIRWKENDYKRTVKNALEISDEQKPNVLPLSILIDKSFPSFDWPVNSRKAPCIGSPMCILDLPNTTNDICRSIVHWSSKNFITAALYNVIYLWHVKTSDVRYVINNDYEVLALKWNSIGTELAFGCSVSTNNSNNRLQIWNIDEQRITYRYKFTARYMCRGLCHISSIDWHPSGKFIATGCSCGSLMILSNRLKPLLYHQAAHSDMEILRVLFSPDGKYLASSGFDLSVQIWIFPLLTPHFKITSIYPCRALSWHPWKVSYLCVGRMDGRLMLINILLKEQISNKTIPANSHLYDITFNKITGELVTSHMIVQDNNNNNSTSQNSVPQINVLSSFNTVVDRLDGHTGRVLYLEWNPNHNILATAGSDETLQLWEFLPKKLLKLSKNVMVPSKESCLKFNTHMR